jgi:channel protein (hemolysin III family)
MVMQRLDHAAIWTMIAGSFTPVHIVMFRGWWRWGVLSLIWTVAITGLVLKTVFFYEIPDWMGIGFYLSLGWIGLFTFIKIYRVYGKENLRLLLLGGLFYTIGAVFEFLHKPVLIPGVIGSHEIFHVFVLLGAFAQWLFIYEWADTPVSDHVRFIIRERPGPSYFASAIGEKIFLESDNLDQLKCDLDQAVKNYYHEKMPALSKHIQYVREEFF